MNLFTTQGILIQDPTSIPFSDIFAPRTLRIDKTNWKYLLKSAIFRSFSKYTGFTSSVDMKMEADTLLWEKIDGGKFITKIVKTSDEDEKSGMVVDMTRDTGYLEFIQVNGSLYNSVLNDIKVLAYWKIKMLDPDRVWIQITIPQEPPLQHMFVYLPGFGLTEVKSKGSRYNKKKTSSSNSHQMKNSEITGHTGIKNPLAAIKRQDHYIVRMHQYDKSIVKNPRELVYRKQTPTIVFKPTPPQYNPPHQEIYSTPLSKTTYHPTWNQESAYYPTKQIKAINEFKQDGNYNGFIPSLGPTRNRHRPIYGFSIDQHYTYPNSYYPTYKPETVTTYKPYPITFTFKPSTQFIQYSEPDPFYSSEDNLTYIPMAANYPIIGNLEGVSGIQTIHYGHIPSTVAVEIPNIPTARTTYDTEGTTINSESITTETTERTESLETTTVSTTNELRGESLKEKQFTTTEMTKPTSERTSLKGRPKNSPRGPHKSSLRGEESYNYAPLYIRWGQKLKSPKNKTKLEQNRTKEGIRLYYKGVIENTNISQNSNNRGNKRIAAEYTTIDNSNTDSFTNDEPTTLRNIEVSETGFDTITTTAPQPSQNEANNRSGKSPEEIVHDLTRLGLKNKLKKNETQDENGRQKVLDQLLNNLSHYLSEDPSSSKIDNEKEASEPISMVVNRISKSVSFKTAEGHIGSLKQQLEKT